MRSERDDIGADDSVRRNPVAAKLEKLEYPVDFSSVDGSKQYSAPIISFGARLFNSYKIAKDHDPAKPDLEKLNLACKQGSYDALIERTESACSIIKSDKTEEYEKKEAKKSLLYDLEVLSLHYWSAGCIHASRVLLDIGNYYDSKQPTNAEEISFDADAQAYWDKAAAYFFRAKLLSKEVTSKYIAKILYQWGDFSPSEFNDWPEAEAKKAEIIIDKHIDPVRKAKIENDESDEIKRKIHRK